MKKILSFFSVMTVILVFSTVSYAAVINVPILCYHSVSTNPLALGNYTISSNEFETDVIYFKNNGYTFITPDQLPDIKSDNKNIILSFDDGYEDFYINVYPVLKKYNAKAVVYIIGSKIDKTNYLKAWQIKEMDKSGLVEIGNHTDIFHSRDKATLINWYNDPVMLNEAIYDIGKCNQRLYEILGHYPHSISYPYGAYNDKLEQSVKNDLMFLTSVSTKHGIVENSTDIYKPMKRVYRIHGDNPAAVEQKIENLKK